MDLREKFLGLNAITGAKQIFKELLCAGTNNEKL